MFKTEKSSNISYIKYDPATNELEVCFKNGSIYNYSGVSQKAYDAFEKAESHGSYFSKHIKNEFKFKRKDDKKDKETK